MTKQKYQLVNTNLTEEDLEDYEPQPTGLSTTVKILLIVLVIIVMVMLFVGGVYVGIVLKDIDAEQKAAEAQPGVISVTDTTGTKVDYTTSEDKCVLILKFPTTGLYTCAILEVIDGEKSTRKLQNYLVKDLTDDYVCILNHYNLKTDYEVIISKSEVSE